MATLTTSVEEKRAADLAVQYEIDQDILDYVIYKAIKSLLHDVQKLHGSVEKVSTTSKVDLHLDMVNCEPCRPLLLLPLNPSSLSDDVSQHAWGSTKEPIAEATSTVTGFRSCLY